MVAPAIPRPNMMGRTVDASSLFFIGFMEAAPFGISLNDFEKYLHL